VLGLTGLILSWLLLTAILRCLYLR